MVSGGFLNCTATSDPIQANADIVGYGVLVSFMLSAFMTVAAVAYAYLSDSMPEEDLRETDKAFIADFQNGLKRMGSLRPFLFLGKCWLFILARLLRHNVSNERQKLSRLQREAAVTRLILALSDQQLATGLAILIAAIANQSTLTISEFQIAFALAWFSITTHLATLDSLRTYLLRNKTLRNWRVFGMLTLLALFLYCFIVILYVNKNDYQTGIPIQCYINGGEDFKEATGFQPWATDRVYATAWISIFLFLIHGYFTRISAAYGLRTNGILGGGFYLVILKYSLLKLVGCSPKSLEAVSVAEWKKILDEAAREKWSETRRKYLESRYRKLTFFMYYNSLLPIVPSLTFMLAFGLVQMVCYRWVYQTLEVDASINFGQIIPLFLLVLPILAAAEIYYEALAAAPEATSTAAIPNDHQSVVRSDTLPITSSSDSLDKEVFTLELNSRLYDSNIILVQRFFYGQTKEIEGNSTTCTTEDDVKAVLRRKQDLWLSTQALSAAESKQSYLFGVKVILVLACLFTITVSIFLNIPFMSLAYVGSFMLYPLYISIFVSRCMYFWSCDLGTYARLLADVRAKSGQKT